jgi:hypothetical protein
MTVLGAAVAIFQGDRLLLTRRNVRPAARARLSRRRRIKGCGRQS